MTLRSAFGDRAAFAPRAGYRLLPFRFGPLDGDRYIVSNDVGEYVLLSREELTTFTRRQLTHEMPLYRALKVKHFLFDGDSRIALDLLALKYRTRAETVARLTGLHIFVVTLRCDHSCHYCQVSRQTANRDAFDMSCEDADRALNLVFQSPSPTIKIEFQGGEPLLNYELIRHVVERAESLNSQHHKELAFVIASNLSCLSDEVLDFCRAHSVTFSTSLDGPADIHDVNRPRDGGGSHAATVKGIARVREALGHSGIAALMTTTPASLPRVEEIVDEYVRLDFPTIFLRSLSPFGFAIKTRLIHRYSVSDWLNFYRRGLTHVLQYNRTGRPVREEFATILLGKMFSPSGTGYVDLRSPAGVGIGALVYNYDGAIYGSDEGRMLAEMGDFSLRLGTVRSTSFDELVTSDKLVALLEATLLESAPMCSDCPFLPFCGADPAYHQATTSDLVGHKALSGFCEKQMGVIKYLLCLLEDDPAARDILVGWAQTC